MNSQDGSGRVCLGGMGSARPVLLVSGLNGASSFWDPIRVHLERSCLVLSYDQPGCGRRADSLGRSLSIDRLALDALAVAQRAFGRERMVVVGHSTGGAIAQAMAAQAPDRVGGLVLSASWLRADTYMHELFTLRQEVLRQAPQFDGPLASLLRLPSERVSAGDFRPRDLAAGQERVLAARMAALLEFRGDEIASKISAPSLILGSRDDLVVPVWHQQQLHDVLGQSSLRLFESGGHFFPLEHPRAYCHEVETWLARAREGAQE